MYIIGILFIKFSWDDFSIKSYTLKIYYMHMGPSTLSVFSWPFPEGSWEKKVKVYET